MPLLCISLLVLVLLPLSLCCDTKRPLTEIQENFDVIVSTYMANTRKNITDKLQNISCPELKHKPPSCRTEKADIVETLLIQACEMLSLREAEKLAKVVKESIDCPCPEKSTKDLSVRSQRKRKQKKRRQNHVKKLCKANAFLSSMTVCYQKLNAQLMDV